MNREPMLPSFGRRSSLFTRIVAVGGVLLWAVFGNVSVAQAQAPDITSDGGGPTAALSIAENQTAVTTVTADDPFLGVVLYSLSGGPDQGSFFINALTGALEFAVAPDFESPADAGADNTYTVEVTATSLLGGGTDTQAITVTVTDVDAPPVISSNGGGVTAGVSVAENQTAVTTVVAGGTEVGAVTYSLTGGVDQGSFGIVAGTGVLTFAVAPDFENPTDSGGNNTYVVEVTATATGGADTQTITVTVTNTADAPPTITSSATASVAENQTAVMTVTATNPEPGAVTFSITGGADQARFNIVAGTGALTFAAAPDFENPTDTGANNTYAVEVTATASGGTDAQAITVTVTDIDAPPVISSNGGGGVASVSAAENQTAVTTVVAGGAEVGAVTYSITGGADAGSFGIVAGTGVLTFAVAPDFENPTDSGGNNTYVVAVTATATGGADAQTITVTVTNTADSPPTITSSATASVAENQTAVMTVTATNPEPGAVTFSITGGADQSHFNIVGSTGVLTFAPAPDFENPTDAGANNTYEVEVTATATGTDAQTITVTVTDVDSPPVISSNGGGGTAGVSVAENQTAVTTVVAGGTEVGAVTYSITGGADQGRFGIVAGTGVLTLAVAPDFESPTDSGGNNTYVVAVTATATGGTDTQTITVTVTNTADAPPSITSNGGGPTAAVSAAENQTAVTTVTATNPESGAVTFTLSGGADQARFNIVAGTGALTFVAAPDFETPADSDTNNTYVVVVTATAAGGTDTQTITVTVTNVAEAPVITSNGGGPTAAISVAENLTAVATVAATNPDTGSVTFSVSGGADQARFSIVAATGALAFIAPPNFETPTDVGLNNTYVVTVTVTASGGTDTQTITVTILNVSDTAPVALGDAYTVNEDATLTVNAPGVRGNDTDADGDTLTVALVSNVANGTLSLAASGAFTYTPNANFSGADSFTYHAVDTAALQSGTVTVAITVSAVNDAPDFVGGPIVAPNAFESVPYVFELAPFFTDKEGDTLFFSANIGAYPVGLPPSLLVDPDGSLTGSRGRLSGTATLADTSDLGPRQVTLTVADRPFTDPQRRETVVPFELTVQRLDRVDLSLTATAAPAPAATGAPVTWQFAVTNTNPAVVLDSVTLSAEFSGTPFTFANTGACTVNGATLTCAVGTIAAGGTVTVVVTGQAAVAGDVLVTSSLSNAMALGRPAVDPDPTNNTAAAVLNVGQSFSSGPAQTIPGPVGMTGAVSGDVDGDGFVDLVVVAESSAPRLYLSVPKDPSDPNGAAFRRLSTSPVLLADTGGASRDALLVDLDGDGDLDLAVANGAVGDAQPNTVFLNDLVAGQAHLVVAAALGNAVSYAVAAGDFNGDGLADLVFANNGPNEVFINRGGAAFQAAAALGNRDSRAVAVADFDGDSLPDLAFANGSGQGQVYRGTGGGNFAAPVNTGSTAAISVRAADFDGDGRPDLIFGGATGSAVYVNTSAPGSVSFAAQPTLLGASPAVDVAVADVSLDGVADVVLLNSTGTHVIFVGTGSGAFSLHPQQFSSVGPAGVATADFNGDGRADAVLVGALGVQLFLNDGLGNLGPGDTAPPTLQLSGQAALTLVVGDAYADAGATAIDAVDGSVTSRIVVTNPVDTAVIGTYTVTYNVTDLSGNKAVPISRTVSVQTRQASGGGGGGGATGLLGLLALGAALLARPRRDQFKRTRASAE